MIYTNIAENKVWGVANHLCVDGAMTSIPSVKEGFRCSNHKHEHRFNKFHIVSGHVRVLISNVQEVEDGRLLCLTSYDLKPGACLTVEPGYWHRFEVIESGVVVETYWTTDGSPVDPYDIIRLDQGGLR